jgi:hypothetical protein
MLLFHRKYYFLKRNLLKQDAPKKTEDIRNNFTFYFHAFIFSFFQTSDMGYVSKIPSPKFT